MGVATTAIGLLPGIEYDRRRGTRPAGRAHRVVQGFAMGGEYGGAAVYVAEHAQSGATRTADQLDPDHRVGRVCCSPSASCSVCGC